MTCIRLSGFHSQQEIFYTCECLVYSGSNIRLYLLSNRSLKDRGLLNHYHLFSFHNYVPLVLFFSFHIIKELNNSSFLYFLLKTNVISHRSVKASLLRKKLLKDFLKNFNGKSLKLVLNFHKMIRMNIIYLAIFSYDDCGVTHSASARYQIGNG